MIRQPREGTTVPEFFRQLAESFPMALGTRVSLTTQATTSPQQYRHGLGRAYRGVVGPTSQDQPTLFTWLPASTADDPATFFTFRQSVAIALSIEVWVF